jgi:flagellar motor protein MotB
MRNRFDSSLSMLERELEDECSFDRLAQQEEEIESACFRSVLDHSHPFRRTSPSQELSGSLELEHPELAQEDEWEVMPARCPLPVQITIVGFSRYHDSVPSSEQAKIRTIASLILSSFQPSCSPMMGVLLIGHADRDAQRGPAFEHEISVKRALQVRNVIRQQIAVLGRNLRIPRGAPSPSSIDWQHNGVGATQLLVPHPVTEDQRAHNRRVTVLTALRSYPSHRPQLEPSELRTT